MNFRDSLFKNHCEFAALPEWARRASDSSHIFAHGVPRRPCPDSCACHEVKKIMDKARAEVDIVVRRALEKRR